MNHTTFLKKAFHGETRVSEVTSLYKDGRNNIYSYGPHYPLLFRASDNADIAFINITGYSNSTIKHIQKAKEAMNGDYVGVKLNGAKLPLTLDEIHSKLGAEVVELHATMASKKRKDTQVYARLQYEFDYTLEQYNKVKELL